jgi:hypothetical protein
MEMNLSDSVSLLERYSAVILPALVVAEQVGVPRRRSRNDHGSICR